MVVAFSSHARILRECSTIHSPPALFFKVKISLRTLIPLFTPGLVHSGSGSWDDGDRVFPDEFPVSSFPDRVPTPYLDSGLVSPLLLCWVFDVSVFRCNLRHAHLAEWRGHFRCHCGSMGEERTPNKRVALVVAFSSRARILGECWRFIPRLYCFCFKWKLACAH